MLFLAQATAQITISYPINAKKLLDDTARVIDTPYATLADTPGINKHWDETGLNYRTGAYAYNRIPMVLIPSSIAVPADWATADSAFISPGLKYNISNLRGTLTAGHLNYGTDISQQTISLASVTSNPADSIIIPSQSVVFSAADTLLKFPATYLTSWQSAYSFSTKFKLYMPASGLAGDTMEKRSYVTTKSAVEGWGMMKVKDANGNNSGFMNVLQVRRSYTQVDSFYLHGTLSAPALVQLGMAQGGKTNTYEVAYYRSGEIFPLMRIWYDDNTYTHAVRVETHTQRLQRAGVGVNTITVGNDIQIYPNPVANHTFTIHLGQGATGSWYYEMIGMNGQRVAAAAIPSGSRSAQVALPASVPAGQYLIRLLNDGRDAGTLQVAVSR